MNPKIERELPSPTPAPKLSLVVANRQAFRLLAQAGDATAAAALKDADQWAKNRFAYVGQVEPSARKLLRRELGAFLVAKREAIAKEHGAGSPRTAGCTKVLDATDKVTGRQWKRFRKAQQRAERERHVATHLEGQGRPVPDHRSGGGE